MGKKITVIQTKIEWPHNIKRVGIYCRVSTASAAQLHSLADQVSGLTQYVYRNPLFRLADVFIDVGSGSDAVNRPEFQRMIQAAQMGRINYIITKSVSRLGRSTIDVLTAVRAVKECGVDIQFFDNEDCSTYVSQSEMAITTYCAIAEGENKSHSDKHKTI